MANFINSLYFKLTFLFLKIGFCGFGGGYAMLSMIFEQARDTVGLTSVEFAELTALDFMIPGPIAINAATYVGYITGVKNISIGAGIIGALLATIGVAIPSYILVTATMFTIDKMKNNNTMQSFLSGIKPAAVGLIASAAFLLMKDNLYKAGITISNLIQNPLDFLYPVSIIIFIAAFVAIVKYKVNPIIVTLASGVVGAFLYGM